METRHPRRDSSQSDVDPGDIHRQSRRSPTQAAMPLSIYQLKPRFQQLLLPFARILYGLGFTANQVTLLACAVSVALGLGLYFAPLSPAWFALLPLWLFLRMALNAIDGMLARDFNQRSALGACLNELTDVISDAALYLPFAKLAGFEPLWIGALILAAALSEMAGVLGQTIGASRRYDGPFGKSDRALVFGVLGLAVALWHPLPSWAGWSIPLAVVLSAVTVTNRVHAGIKETRSTPR
jgi:CDP-diacylglycerol--glycerol-3-phosphate 3-phosphatidyltransferase